MRFVMLIVLALLAWPAAAQSGEAIPREAAIAAAQVRLGERPLSWTYEILAQTNNSALGCPLVPAGDLGRQVLPYRYTLTFTSGDYVVYASSDGTVVVLCDQKFASPSAPTATPTPTPAAGITPQPATGCEVTPVGAFANVRATPNTAGAQVAQIFSGQRFAVAARSSNPSDQWYFIAPGWVSAQVVTVSGSACASLPVDDARVGTGAGAVVPSTDVNVAAALQTYACPADFAGYLVPRIRVGSATAKVEAGGLPNVLRAQPVANDQLAARLGTIQPNRTIDRVINGPACSGGYVWWLVEVDGTQGWTVESDFAQEAYFLEPTPGNEVVAAATPSAPVAAPALEGIAPVTLQKRDDTTAAEQVTILADGAFALASDVIGENTFVAAEYALDPANPAFTDTGIAETDAIADLKTLADGTIAVITASRITYYQKDGATYTPTLTVTDLPVSGASSYFTVVSDDGLVFAFHTCTASGDDPCAQSRLALRSFNAAVDLWAVELPDGFVVSRIVFSPDGQLVAALGFEAVYLFDRITGIQQAVLSNATAVFGMLDVAFHPTEPARMLTSICKRADGAGAVSGCTGGEITLWDLVSNQAIGIVETNNANPLFVAYTPQGDLILVADASGVTTVRSAANGVLRANLAIPSDAQTGAPVSVVDMAISADGNQYVAVGSDGQIYWWDLSSLRP
jgi:WD40 repeat protein